MKNDKSFLERFPVDMRSHVANLFYMAVRSGCKEIEAICSFVKNKARGRYSDLPDVIDEHFEEAEDFARYAVKYEALPKTERERIKENRKKHYMMEYQKGQPPTDRQLQFLAQKGYKEGVNNKWEASQIITRLINGS